MADELNWGSLYDESGDADQALPAQDYQVEVTKAEVKTTKNGKTMFAISAKVLAGPHTGRFVWNNITVSPENPNAMRMFFLNMAALGLSEGFFKRSPAPTNQDVAAALIGRRATFSVGIQASGPYAGRNEVKNIKAASTPAPGVAPAPTAGPAPQVAPPAAAPIPVPTVPQGGIVPSPTGPAF